jgi:hypothetical protein
MIYLKFTIILMRLITVLKSVNYQIVLNKKNSQGRKYFQKNVNVVEFINLF